MFVVVGITQRFINTLCLVIGCCMATPNFAKAPFQRLHNVSTSDFFRKEVRISTTFNIIAVPLFAFIGGILFPHRESRSIHCHLTPIFIYFHSRGRPVKSLRRDTHCLPLLHILSIVLYKYLTFELGLHLLGMKLLSQMNHSENAVLSTNRQTQISSTNTGYRFSRARCIEVLA
jgi:hypothetical protein